MFFSEQPGKCCFCYSKFVPRKFQVRPGEKIVQASFKGSSQTDSRICQRQAVGLQQVIYQAFEKHLGFNHSKTGRGLVDSQRHDPLG